MSRKFNLRRPFTFVSVLLIGLTLVGGLAACGHNKTAAAFKKTDQDVASLMPKLKRSMLTAIEIKTKAYTEAAAKKALVEKMSKAERAVKKLEALDKAYRASADTAKAKKVDVPDMKHLHKNEAQAYRDMLESVKNPTTKTVQDKAIKRFDAVVSYTGSGQKAAIQNELHKTYDAKLNSMLNARFKSEKQAQQAKDKAAKLKQESASEQQAAQDQIPAQSAPQQPVPKQNNGGQRDGAGQNDSGSAPSGQQTDTSPAGQTPTRPAQNQGQSQGEWQVKPAEKQDANGNYIDSDGSVHNELDLSQGFVPR